MNIKLSSYFSIKWILYLLPFSALGIKFGDFLFSIIFLPIIVLNISVIRSNRISSSISLILLFLLSVFFFSAFGKFPLLSFAPSLLILTVLFFPFIGVYPGISKKLLIEDLQKSFLLLTGYCFLEFFVSLLSIDLMFDIENFIGFDGSTTTYRGIRRLRGGFLEPSVLAIALNFYFAIFAQSRILKKNRNKLLITCAILIILTFSSIGIIGFVLNLVFLLLSVKKRLSFSFSSLTIIVLGLVLLISQFWEQVFKVFEKILNIATVIRTGNIEGSVGYRVSSLLIIPDFFGKTNMREALFGIGFSNYSEFISSHYGLSIYSGFYDGSIGNVFSAVIISTGLIGFIFFLIWIMRISLLPSKMSSLLLLLLISYGFLSFGNIISPWIWQLVFIYKLIFCKPFKIKNNEINYSDDLLE